MQSCCNSKDFIGHIGGDDFVAIFEGKNCIDCCKKITEEFDLKVREYYNDKDLQAGGIEANSRTGQLQFFPLLSLAVGIVEPDLARCHSHHDVAELASEAKKRAKQAQGSNVFVSRRGGPTEASNMLNSKVVIA
jgi:GGDEF domain-containing protein